MPNIKSDVKKLRAGKSGGVSAVTSYCFIDGTDSLYAFIAMLFNALLLHGTLPNDFWCLFYKSNCSTIMCSTLVIETIQYFTQMQSPVYVLFIDASKAFDRLCHIELFNILSEQNMCPLVRCLVFNLYGKQQFQMME